jgi:hypothetical protein
MAVSLPGASPLMATREHQLKLKDSFRGECENCSERAVVLAGGLTTGSEGNEKGYLLFLFQFLLQALDGQADRLRRA